MSQETKQENEDVELKDLINDVENVQSRRHDPDPEQNTYTTKSQEEEDVDILNLPPRKTVHEQNKKRLKIKLNLPLLRFLLVLAVVIGLLITAWVLFKDELQDSLINTDGLLSMIIDLNMIKCE